MTVNQEPAGDCIQCGHRDLTVCLKTGRVFTIREWNIFPCEFFVPTAGICKACGHYAPEYMWCWKHLAGYRLAFEKKCNGRDYCQMESRQ